MRNQKSSLSLDYSLRCRVKYDFQALNNEELSCSCNEVLGVLAHCSGWYLCIFTRDSGADIFAIFNSMSDEYTKKYMDGREFGLGLVPKSYVDLMGFSQFSPKHLSTNDPKSGNRDIYVTRELEDKISQEKETVRIPHVLSFKFQLLQACSQLLPNNNIFVSSGKLVRENSSEILCTNTNFLDPKSIKLCRVAKYSEFSKFEQSYDGDVFRIDLVLNDDRKIKLIKSYYDLYSFHKTILKQFPQDKGINGSQRLIPPFPGPVSKMTESIAAKRREDIHRYVCDLLRLPAYIVESDIVKSFFNQTQKGNMNAPKFYKNHTNELPWDKFMMNYLKPRGKLVNHSDNPSFSLENLRISNHDRPLNFAPKQKIKRSMSSESANSSSRMLNANRVYPVQHRSLVRERKPSIVGHAPPHGRQFRRKHSN